MRLGSPYRLRLSIYSSDEPPYEDHNECSAMKRVHPDAQRGPEYLTHPQAPNGPDLRSNGLSEGAKRSVRLAEIRKSLADGSYRVGSDQIATRLMDKMSEGASDESAGEECDTDQEHRV